MLFSASLSLGLALVPFAAATVHDVTVGGAGGVVAYSPEAISAEPGDQVVFHFEQKNHTVSQSSFANPCGLTPGGFDSGFYPVAANVTDNFPTYTITVNDTTPIWVYCAQFAKTPESHCGQGMVFAVNCGADGAPNSFTNFKNAALAVGASLSAAAAASSTAAVASASAIATVTESAGGSVITIGPNPTPSTVTAVVTLASASSTWTTVYGSYPGSPAPTPASVSGTVHTIIVGGNSTLTFNPSRISAAPRDIVVFEFHQKNHTVTQSAFAEPCVKLSSNGTTGFDSDFVPVAANVTSGFPTFNITISDTNPIWAYCKQRTPESHCGQGMVFAINSVENSTHSFAAFQALAIQINGTNSSSTSSSSGVTPSSTSGAMSLRMGASLALGAVGAFVVLFL